MKFLTEAELREKYALEDWGFLAVVDLVLLTYLPNTPRDTGQHVTRQPRN